MARITPLATAGVLLVGAGLFLLQGGGYTVDVVMPSATNLVRGSMVQVDGATAGSVTDIAARDGKAVVSIELDDEFAPLRNGTTATIAWKATLGERILDLQPAPEENRELPDGTMIEGTVDRVELDQVLAALDAPTRRRLQSLLDRLDQTLSGSEGDLRATLTSAGPAVEALGQVLQAVGDDGPAIRALVSRMRSMTTAVSARRAELTAGVSQLGSALDLVSTRQESLQQLLRELPGTLDTATGTLGRIPGTVDAATPLLRDLRPAAARLPGIARQLSPVLRDLRPTVAELKPTLAVMDVLMSRAPGLLGAVTRVSPQIGMAGETLSPMLAYLRPYMPELAGWLANWGSGAANYDANGHYLRAFAQEGPSSINHNPGVLPPGVTQKLTRLPGESEGQPWTDAHGSEMR